jgi:phospholipid N-methyltransferase
MASKTHSIIGTSNPGKFSFIQKTDSSKQATPVIQTGFSTSAFTTALHRRANTCDSLAVAEAQKDSLNQSSIKSPEQNTCVKLPPKKQNRYSNSPLGKRFDIYETSEDGQEFSEDEFMQMMVEADEVKVKEQVFH